MKKLNKSIFNVHISNNDRYCISNTLTGSVIEVDCVNFEAIKNNNISEITCNVEDLIKQGFLVNANLDELALIRHTYSYSKYDKNTSHITICPTLECNFCCPYCYEVAQEGSMDEDTQNNTINFIEKILRKGIEKINLTWYGGEPLLYPNIISALAKKISIICKKFDAELSSSMITNGYLLNLKNIEILKDIGVSKIQITIDGTEKVHNARRKLKNGGGTYSKILENILHLESTTISVLVRVNIDRSNYAAFDNVKNTFASFKNVTCYPALVTEEKTQNSIQRSKCYAHNEQGIFFKQLFKKSFFDDLPDLTGNGVCTCMAEHLYSYVIDYNGFTYKCLNDLGNKNYSVGSVLDPNTISEIPISKYLGRDPFTEIECNKCAYLPLCFGGCAWEYHNKKIHACPPIKYLYEDAIIKKYLTR